MYNPGGRARLAVQASTITPRTPEILDEVSAWLPPCFGIGQSGSHSVASAAAVHKLNQCDSHSSCSGSPLDSPAGSNAPPSVEQTHSKLVKATLKLSLEMKRKNSGSGGDYSETDNMKMAKLEYNDTTDDDDDDEDDTDSKSTRYGLTPEDEDRRKKRRERNKIAATKCRKKKRERTINLVTESEQLETQNVDLKTAVRQLELERRKLTAILQAHSDSSCGRPGGFQPPTPPTIAVGRFLSDLDTSGAEASHSRHSSRNAQPIPSVTTIGKFGHAKATAKTRSRAGQPRNQQPTSTMSTTALPPHSTDACNTTTADNTITSTSSSSTDNIIAANASGAAASLVISLEAIQQQTQQQQQQQPQLPLDIHTYLGTNISSSIDLLLPSNYCKASPNEYAMSPDSGFIKSPVDSIGSNYSTTASTVPVTSSSSSSSSNNSSAISFQQLINHNNNNNNANNVNNNMLQQQLQQQQHLKNENDFIPTPSQLCNIVDMLSNPGQFDQLQPNLHQQALLNNNNNQSSHHTSHLQANSHPHLQHQHQQQQQHHHQQHHHHHHHHHQLTDALIGPGDGSEFALKCEMVDSVSHSPYTTEQSADRFLYESVIIDDSSPMFADGASLCATALDQVDLKLLAGHLQPQQQQLLNNNNSQQQQHNHHQQQQQQQHNNGSIQPQQQNNQHQQQQHHHQQQNHHHHNGGGIVEFSSSHNGLHNHGGATGTVFNDYHQHADFLTLSDSGSVGIGGDAHFTDMDSGHTYANFLSSGTASNGGNNGCMA